MWQAICDTLSKHLGQRIEYAGTRGISGGCIHQTQVLDTNRGPYFVKLNEPDQLPVFQAEAHCLEAIRQTGAIRCPEVILSGLIPGKATLILEFIPLHSQQPGGMEKLGQQLAALHRCTGDRYGWPGDNFIGATPQPNVQELDWIAFFKKHRLGFQLQLAGKMGLRLNGQEELLKNLDTFFAGYSPIPSLLHGDLWGGNKGFDDRGEPVVFDPASYYGDREADLAFTEMFGGFSSEFYQSYQEMFPLDQGYKYRKRLYNLYHELNHYNLFGGGYGRQAQETIQFLLQRL